MATFFHPGGRKDPYINSCLESSLQQPPLYSVYFCSQGGRHREGQL